MDAANAKAARAAENNSAIMISVICVVWGLSFVTACARFYTRAVLVRSFAKDDIFMVFAVVSHRALSCFAALSMLTSRPKAPWDRWSRRVGRFQPPRLRATPGYDPSERFYGAP